MSSVAPQRVLAGSGGNWRSGVASAQAQRNTIDVDFAPAMPEAEGTATRNLLIAGIALTCLFFGAVVAAFDLNAVYLCAATIAFGFVLRDFRVGVLFLILLIPVSRSSVFPHAMLGVTGLNPVNLLLVVTLGSYLLHALTSGGLRRFVPLPLLLLYMVPLIAAGIHGSMHVNEILPGFVRHGIIDFRDETGYFLEVVLKPMTLVITALLVGAAVASSAKPERFVVPILVSVWIVSAIVIGFVLGSGIALNQLASSESREFLSALGLHANELGHMYATLAALLLFMWGSTDRPRLKVALVATMGVSLCALMLTFSRSAFFGTVVAGFLYVLWHRNFRTMALAAIVVIASFFALPDAVYERITSGFGEGLNAISAGRINQLWLPLLPEVWKSPIYGNGLSSILWSEPMRAGAGKTVLAVTHPHNAYLEAVLDVGFAGFILLCVYFATVLKGLFRMSRDPAVSPTMHGFYLGAAAGLIGLLIADIADSSLAPRPEQAFLWFAIGMMYGQRART